MYCIRCGGRRSMFFFNKCDSCKTKTLRDTPTEWSDKNYGLQNNEWFKLTYEERRKIEEESFIPFLRETDPDFSEEAYQHRLEKEQKWIEDDKKLKEKNAKEHEEYLRKQRAEWDRRAKYTPRCPICGSPRIKKISAVTKAGGVALFGPLGMRKALKQWHCEDCGSDF